MNFKRNLFSIITLVCSVFAFSGCSSTSKFTRYEFIEEVSDKHLAEGVDGIYFKPGDFAPYEAVTSDTESGHVSLGSTYNLLTKHSGKNIIKSTGDRKILVVPVEFSDYDPSNLNVTREDYVTNLEKAFFGTYKNNKYVSVSEYYNRSSYGKLRISGKVCNKFYTFSKPIADIEKNQDRKIVFNEYDSILKWYSKTFTSPSDEPLDSFRLDNGDVAIYLVYDHLSDDSSVFFWDYTFLDKPLSWTSYSSLYAISGEPDAHTLIHETGHLLGLVDYYPTKGDVEPVGRIDMMDSSIGDHSAFSKMMLDWARPYQILGSTDINISPLVDKGDLILINNHWNKTVFDEYYLLEFYTPTGLNAYDTRVGNDSAKLPSLPGVKIYHVDARLGYFTSSSRINGKNDVFAHYCDEYDGENTKCPSSNNIDFAHDNITYINVEESETYKNNYLYELELNHIGHPLKEYATNFNLFHSGDTFEIKSTSWNKQNDTSFKITIGKMTYRDVTINIEKL